MNLNKISEWKYKCINEIADPISEQAGSRRFETLSISAGIGFVNQAKKFGKELSGKQYEKYIVLKKGDFSYNKGNSKTYPQGCIYRLKDRKEAAVPNVFESFRITQGDADYYEQLFISGYLNKQLSRKINHGVRDDGLLNLTDKDFYSCVVPVPPIKEQKKIAEILIQCDRIIELYQSMIDQLQTLKKVCLRKMFPQKGANVPEWRFPQFTDAWEQRKLGSTKTFFTDGNYGESYPKASDMTNSSIGVPFLTGGNLKEGRLDITGASYITKEKHELLTSGHLIEDDIVIAVRGSLGALGYVNKENEDWNINSQLAILRTDKTEIFGKYLLQFLLSGIGQKELIRRQTGTALKQLPIGAIKDVEIPITSIEEQKKIGDCLFDIDNLITLHQRKLDEQKRYKKSLMQLLLTGIVRVK